MRCSEFKDGGPSHGGEGTKGPLGASFAAVRGGSQSVEGQILEGLHRRLSPFTASSVSSRQRPFKGRPDRGIPPVSCNLKGRSNLRIA